MSKRLPVEVISEIIALVAEDDQERRGAAWNIGPASLVSHLWNSICRPRIFHTIAVGFGKASLMARFSFLHCEAPHLSVFIHQLELSSWPSDDSIVEEWFPECCGRLKNLRVLSLEPHAFRRYHLSMAPVPLVAGILSMLSVPCLRKLVLRGWAFSKEASDLLTMLPANLEQLILEDIDVNDGMCKPETICLHALRSIEFVQVHHPMLELESFIQCPNLRSVTGQWHFYQKWILPPWIPDTLSELSLCASVHSDIPNFGTAVRLSALTIELDGDAPYFHIFTGIKDCIDHLPFPNSIQSLAVDITHSFDIDDSTYGLYPELSDYVVLSQCFQQLYECGELKSVVLNIKGHAEVDSVSDDLQLDEARELEKLETGFAALLRVKVLKADDFTLRRFRAWAPEPVIHCRT